MVTFEGINSAAPGSYSINISSRKDYQPARATLKLDGQTTVTQLKKGNVLQGQVIDAKTGWPVPGAQVYAIPEKWHEGEFSSFDAEEKTDSHGKFRFSNLNQESYSFNSRDANPADPMGKAVGAPGSGDVQLRVVLPEWSKLKPARPID